MHDVRQILDAYRLGFRTGCHQGRHYQGDAASERTLLASYGMVVSDQTREALREGVADGIRGLPVLEPAERSGQAERTEG